jgi:hypothetical protein
MALTLDGVAQPHADTISTEERKLPPTPAPYGTIDVMAPATAGAVTGPIRNTVRHGMGPNVPLADTSYG